MPLLSTVVRILALTLATALGLASTAAAQEPLKVLRTAFNAPETGFDPVQISDAYSRTITAHIFEGLYTYDHLAQPFKIKPLTAAAMPEVSSDFKTWTIRIKPGIYFADDPAFKGRKRELVAQDYVYAFKRFFDPANRSPGYSSMREETIIGLEELREKAVRNKQPFDYDTEVEGLRALDRHTLQIKLAQPRPRLLYTLASSDVLGAVAREVIEAYPGHSMEHPVGTGPFRLKSWRRSSLIVLEKNPGFREMFYDAEPNPDDAQGQAWLAKFKGRRLPMVDEVHVSIIEESQPRWLAFLNGQIDYAAVPLEFTNYAMPNGKLSADLQKKGMVARRFVGADFTFYYFNMEDPVVGGYTPEKVALRRAISLGTDIEREIRLLRRGQAIPAQSVMMPGTYGYDPNFKTENSDYSAPRAKALLDLYGYVDRDGDGWRDLPDGRPLVLEVATQPDALSRQFDELWKKNMDAINVRIRLMPAKWPENLKAARAGKLMIWSVGSSAASPDAQGALERYYGKSAGGANLARFKHEGFDTLYERMLVMPDGPEREALFKQASKIAVAYMPMKLNVHRIATDLNHPWVEGYRRALFWPQVWQYIDVDMARRPKSPQ